MNPDMFWVYKETLRHEVKTIGQKFSTKKHIPKPSEIIRFRDRNS